MLRWALILLAIVLVGAVAVVVSRGDEPEPAATPTPEARLELDDHLRALQRIATEQGGTRAAGSPGDAATVDYIERRLREAGYRVTRQSFRVPYYRESAPPRLLAGGRRVRPVRTLQFSPGGRASGRVRAAGLGCSSGDFSELRSGEIALVQRGTCFFRIKADNAQRAGAAALLVVDQNERPVAGTLAQPGLRIPALALGSAAGEGLEGRRVTVVVRAVSEQRETASVIGETGPEDAPRVMMAGGHLDSVPAGPGLNDNGSGVAALLQVAERLADSGRPLRFGFWAAEEIGLLGSRRYLDELSRAERRRIAGYVNLDMVGSPGGEFEVYDDDRRIEDALRDALPRGTDDVSLEGNSDHASFQRFGIPVGGIFTGLDDCYHQRCDRLGNVDVGLAERASEATEAALLDLTD